MKKFRTIITVALAALIAATLAFGAFAATSITLENAKQIAVDHAKLASDKVTFTKAKLDNDDGVRVYDVEFYYGDYEYEYEINASSGKIVEFDKELNDRYDADDRYDDLDDRYDDRYDRYDDLDDRYDDIDDRFDDRDDKYDDIDDRVERAFYARLQKFFEKISKWFK